MSRDSKARIAVVTGGTSGIGLATSRLLLERGCRVALFGQKLVNVESADQALCQDFGSERVFARDSLAAYLEREGVEYTSFATLGDLAAALA